jgi:hypothetical protein
MPCPTAVSVLNPVDIVRHFFVPLLPFLTARNKQAFTDIQVA